MSQQLYLGAEVSTWDLSGQWQNKEKAFLDKLRGRNTRATIYTESKDGTPGMISFFETEGSVINDAGQLSHKWAVDLSTGAAGCVLDEIVTITGIPLRGSRERLPENLAMTPGAQADQLFLGGLVVAGLVDTTGNFVQDECNIGRLLGLTISTIEEGDVPVWLPPEAHAEAHATS